MPRVRVSEVLDSKERSIFAVERLDTLATRRASGVLVNVSMRPVALIVRDARNVRAFDMDANLVDLDRLCDENPGLDVALEEAVAQRSRS